MSEIKFKPLNKIILVNPDPPQNMIGSIYISDQSAEKQKQTGTVIKMGNDVPTDEINIGDKIMFSQYCGREYVIGDKEYKLVSLDDILLVMETGE